MSSNGKGFGSAGGRNPFGKNRCKATGKSRFRDHEQAVAALHRAVGHRAVAQALGVDCSRAEVRCYWCDSCSGWHLTSQREPAGSRPANPMSGFQDNVWRDTGPAVAC